MTSSVPLGRMIRVLTLIDKPIAIGGAERLATELTIALDPEKFARYFCATRLSPFRQLRDELERANVHYVALGRKSRWNLIPWLRLIRYLRNERIDVLHSHLFGSNFWATTVGRLAGVPVVVAHEHTWSYSGRPIRKLIDRYVISRLADTVIAVSEADRAKMTRRERIPSERITVVRNGISSPHPRRTRQQVRDELGLEEQTFVVTSVAVLRPQKRLDRLLRAVEILRDDLPNFRFLVVGDGYDEERDKLLALRRELHLEPHVMFLGERGDAIDIAAASDAGVITSDFEGIPLALLEFMALGIPVAATAVGGVAEVLRDGETGVLASDCTDEAVAAAILRLWKLGVSGRQQLGAAAQDHQRQEFTFPAYVDRVSGLYMSLLALKAK